jgi:transcriptional regulator with XRE-family HTH domain
MDYSELMKDLRRIGLTQQDIADELGCAQPTVQRIEAGIRKPGADLLLKLLEMHKHYGRKIQRAKAHK